MLSSRSAQHMLVSTSAPMEFILELLIFITKYIIINLLYVPPCRRGIDIQRRGIVAHMKGKQKQFYKSPKIHNFFLASNYLTK